MESFKPFRATVHRQQKYYSERRNSGQNKTPVFNLPRQIIAQKSVILINPEILKNVPDPEHKIAMDYQSNLKKTMKKHSLDLINKKALEKITSTFVQMDSIPRQINDRIIRNKSSEIHPNKSIAFKTLNILYRTIIETKQRTKKKESFELSAKRLPILQKGTLRDVSLMKGKKEQNTNQKLSARNSSFDKYKLNLTTISDNSVGKELEKYNNLSMERGKESLERSTLEEMVSDKIDKEGFSMSIKTRRGRFKRDQSERVINEIVPWNMFQMDQESMEMYE